MHSSTATPLLIIRITKAADTMSKRHADSSLDENPPKRRKLSADKASCEVARNGVTTAVRVGLGQRHADRDTVAFDAVHDACRENDHNCLALLLPFVETTQLGFGLMLRECIQAGYTACTEVLLQHWKAVCNNIEHIDTKNSDGHSPLHIASRSGELANVKILVEAGAGVRVADNRGITCLIFAAAWGHTETVRYLVGLPDVDVNHRDISNNTALHRALQGKHTDVVEVLIGAGADIDTKNNDGHSPLYLASRVGGLETNATKGGVENKTDRRNRRHQRNNNSATKGGAENKTDRRNRRRHRNNNSTNATEGGVENKTDRRSRRHQRSNSNVRMLVEAGAGVRDTDNNGCTCLFPAAAWGHTETVRYLVGLPDVDVNHRDINDYTALHCAVEKHTRVVQVLVDAGADIGAKDNKGRTPLLWASRFGELANVKILVEAGARVRDTDNDGCTCLIFAAAWGHTETVRYLVGLPDVDVNHLGMNNHTALHYALHANHPSIVQMLLGAGVDAIKDVRGTLAQADTGVHATDGKGFTSLMLASLKRHTETVRLWASRRWT